MKKKGYLIFHLNLAFSSIEEDSWPEVIKTCYHPLLDLIEKMGIPIGIELTGWTLKQIERVDFDWVTRFKELLKLGKCELIGSGYCQIIGPLVPSKVNEWNQKIGIASYNKILGCRPEIVLVNEMAFSSSLVDLYHQFGYTGFIMDRDNIKLALSVGNSVLDEIPTHAKGPSGEVMPVLWSDSILFQKVQHFAHGDISVNEYLDYLKGCIDGDDLVFPIYGSDAEVFDYRPGRFGEERPTHKEGEWKRIETLLRAISVRTEIEFISPTEALKINSQGKVKLTSKFTTASYPVPVKKQAKYNIARWAVTGRNNLWFNTMCHRIEQQLSMSKNNCEKDWSDLCELWASDLRTHITEKRLAKATDQLNTTLYQNNISNVLSNEYDPNLKYSLLKSIVGKLLRAKVEVDKEGILLRISTEKMKLELNLKKGLTIKNLAFFSHGMESCIGTLPHGHFSSISLGADYYSGGVVIELPLQRARVTDLVEVEPKFLIKDNGDIQVSAEIITSYGTIIKVVQVSINDEQISLSYSFPDWDKMVGSVRLGIMTLMNQFCDGNTKILCSNGGINREAFVFNGEFNHAAPASSLASSSRGLGATTGNIEIINNDRNLNLNWLPSQCAVMPMLHKERSDQKVLSRVLFSMKEVDDTIKKPSNIGSFSISISTS